MKKGRYIWYLIFQGWQKLVQVFRNFIKILLLTIIQCVRFLHRCFFLMCKNLRRSRKKMQDHDFFSSLTTEPTTYYRALYGRYIERGSSKRNSFIQTPVQLDPRWESVIVVFPVVAVSAPIDTYLPLLPLIRVGLSSNSDKNLRFWISGTPDLRQKKERQRERRMR